MFLRDVNIKYIASKLSFLSVVTKNLNSIKLLDINIGAEEFFKHLLNLVFNLKLQNVNRIVENFPAIDLGDEVNRIAYQITSDSSRNKIQETIDGFIRHNLHKQYSELFILTLTDKLGYTKQFETQGLFDFDLKKNILDISSLIRTISQLDDDQIQAVKNFVSKEIDYLEQASPLQLIEQGNFHYSNKEYEKAYEHFHKANVLDGDFPDALIGRGQSFHRMGFTDKAMIDLEQAIKLTKFSSRAYEIRSQIFREKKLFDKALDDINAAIALTPKNTELYRRKAKIYIDADDLDNAIECYEEAIKLDSKDAHAFHGMGIVYGMKKKLSLAGKFFCNAISLGPGNLEFEASYLYLQSQMCKNDIQAKVIREKYIQLIESEPNCEVYLTQYADFLQSYLDEVDEPQALYLQALAINPVYSPALNNLGYLIKNKSIFQSKDYQLAESCFQKALELSPFDCDLLVNYANFTKGWGNDQAAAKKLFQQSLAINPNHVSSLMNYANLLCEVDEFEEAENMYLAALQIEPESRVLNLNLGIYYKNVEKFDQADAYYEKAYRLNSYDEDTFWRCGSHFSKRNQIELAHECFMKLIGLDTNIKMYLREVLSFLVEHYPDSNSISSLQEKLKILREDSNNEAMEIFNVDHSFNVPENEETYKITFEMLNKGDVDGAIQVLETLLDDEWTNQQIWLVLGKCYEQKGDEEKVSQCLDRAIKLMMRYAEATIKQADYLANNEDYKEAVKLYYEALEIEPHHYFAWHNLGSILLGSGLFEEAEECFENAIEINNIIPVSKISLAKIHLARGQTEQAFELIRDALSHYPQCLADINKDFELNEIHFHPNYVNIVANAQNALDAASLCE